MSQQRMRVLDYRFVIQEPRLQPALEALQRAVREKPEIVDANGMKRVCEFQTPHSILWSSFLPDVFYTLGYEVLVEFSESGPYPYGSIVGLRTKDYFPAYNGDEDLYFQILAPYIEPDSYLEMESVTEYATSEEHWRWLFDGDECTCVTPLVIWPPEVFLIEAYRLFLEWRSLLPEKREQTEITFNPNGSGGISAGIANWQICWNTPEEAVKKIQAAIEPKKEGVA